MTLSGWGTKLVDSLIMIVGEIQGVHEITLSPMDTFEEFYQKVKAKIQSMPENSLIITDIFGGPKRKVVFQNITLDEKDAEILKELGNKNIKIFFQTIPEDKPQSLTDILKKYNS